MDLGVQGRRAVVTGASLGIGAAVARTLVAEGVEVIAAARRPGPLAALRRELADAGGSIETVVADVTAVAGIDALVDAVAERPVDIVVNNVGGAEAKGLLDLDVDDWVEALDLNLLSAVRTTASFLPGMLARGWGRIVHVSSIAAREPGGRLAPYAAAKAALLAYSKALSGAVARHGILSSVVLPGLTATDTVCAQVAAMAEQGMPTDQAMAALMGRRRPATRRIAQADEVAAAVAFLCSARASAITGAALAVDGGTLAGSW